jgi:hypothetical protein
MWTWMREGFVGGDAGSGRVIFWMAVLGDYVVKLGSSKPFRKLEFQGK